MYKWCKPPSHTFQPPSFQQSRALSNRAHQGPRPDTNEKEDMITLSLKEAQAEWGYLLGKPVQARPRAHCKLGGRSPQHDIRS